jgi:hypothetical protein
LLEKVISRRTAGRLRVLHLGRRVGIPDEGLATLAKHCTALQTLHVGTVGLCTTPTAVAALVSKCPVLEGVDIAHCGDGPIVLEALAKHCPQQQHLHLWDARRLTAAQLRNLLNSYPVLHTISLDEKDTEELFWGTAGGRVFSAHGQMGEHDDARAPVCSVQ